MTSAGWLEAKAREYHRSAANLERLGGVTAGIADEQWAIIYRAISAELYKCAREAEAWTPGR